MELERHTWALVLAGGDGSRLRHLTTTAEGVTVPKQFCSLRGGPSLLQEALERAKLVTSRDRICTIVAAQHRHWWHDPLWRIPASNVIVQPQNRGTANGLLFSLLHLLRCDPEARIAVLPSDHHVQEEAILGKSIRQALLEIERGGNECILLGLEPDKADPELGYIVPAIRHSQCVCAIEEFVEKPTMDAATCLIEQGALWNAFILVARAGALLRILKKCLAEIVTEMRTAIELDRGQTSYAPVTAELYARLPAVDFSRHIAQGHEHELRVLRVPQCGWSDLGTPVRVVETLRRLSAAGAPMHTSRHAPLTLAAQHDLKLAIR